MSSDRPKPDDLVAVPDHEYVLRLINPKGGAYQANPPDGRHLADGWVPSGQYKPSPTSYGPSVWVESRLPEGVASLEALRPDWKSHGLVRVLVSAVRACNIDVRYSPQDSIFPEHKDAHASFIGIDRPRRDELIDRCQHCIVRHPAPPNDDET